MTLKEFLESNTMTAVDVVEDYNLILNIYVEEALYGLDVDTSIIPSGTPLTKFEDFQLVGDILSVDDITIDTNNVNML